MNAPLLLGIDIGTTGAKAVLCDATGRILAQAGQEYPTRFPHPNWAEQNPDAWWQATCAIVRRVLAAAGPGRLPEIAAILVSSQAPTLVAVDRSGQPVLPALIWMDRRSEEQCAWLRDRVGDDTTARICGGRIDSYYLAPKLLWLRAQAPEAYGRTWQVLQANGYIVHRLCGAVTMDSSHGPLTHLYDTATQQWSDALIDAMGVDRRRLPPIVPCVEIVGKVTAAAAASTGLAAGTPVAAGMTDGTAAGIEAGLVRLGDAVEMTGQSTVLLICSDRPYQGKDLFALGHPVPGLHLVVGAMVASGGALRWFRDQLGATEREEAARLGVDPFELLSQTAANSPPGANRLVFLPYMYGERSPIWDSHARGVFFGLSLATQKADLVRAILEGAAYGLRHNVEVAQAAGFDPVTLACVGGGARSALWNQIKADVLNRPIRLPEAPAGAAMGDAVVAAVAAGIYPSLEAAVAAMVTYGQSYQPDPANAAGYDALYQVYRKLYPQLRDLFRELGEAPCD